MRGQWGEEGQGQRGWSENQTAFLKKVFFRECIESFQDPQTCFTLGLECLFHIYSCQDSFESSPNAPNPGGNGNYRSHYKSKKRIDFEMGPSVKFVSPNKGLISKKKLGVNFFRRENDQTGGGGGGSGGGFPKNSIFPHFFFWILSFKCETASVWE